MLRFVTAAALAVLMVAGVVHAQDWPNRPVTMIVPFAAGGPIDVLARVLQPGLSEKLGEQVIIENVGGAGGMTGGNRLARAAPDGYTIGIGNQATHTFSQIRYKKPLYDATTDFTPVGLLVANSKVLVTRKDLPVNNLKEFIAYAKANEGKMQYGSAGGGSATHIACVLLTQKMAAPNITHVPYRGTALAMQDLTAGRIDFLCDITSTSVPQIASGRIKAIAVLKTTRSPVLPDVPTALEQGLADVDADGWNGFFVPKGTPDAIVDKLYAVTQEVLALPAVQKRFKELGLDVPADAERSPEFLAKLVRQELDKWGPPIRAAGLAGQ
jgi:tripartite-type tricarboxylate transporter receptor subunit TctC